ncbi:PHP domain-containing protein [Acinetobacter qingfengensis]|uniref:Phosphatase n=1 Tax=Acinetobacter qingfengensis TaxID=1262585 RepID=A0A1E7RFK5_9GAMM|nr:PHP domain-containing protein [Acinetobacter qingfengensis]KAA8731835.1 PHP domain-containing protein [Acinetobacter qingfengensis]OEY98042.1 phosphatase [Acinetobacter qingfengensis]
MIGVDLHTHSSFSDGELSPEFLLQKAAEHNIRMLALTDHDTMQGNDIAAQHAKAYDIDFIQGVEISSWWHRPNTRKTYSVHIVALNMQNLLPMQKLLIKQKQLRAERALLICEKLQKILKTDFLPDVRALVDGHDDRITRSHIAKTLLKHRVVSRMQQAFDRFLKEGKAAYVPFMGVELPEAIEIIHQSQGVAVLAHPTKYDLSATNIRYLIELFAQANGDAVELPPVNEAISSRQMIDREVEKFGLKVSIGSDFHGSHMPWLTLGKVPQLKAGQQGIWESFRLDG